jgi:hypothetical protein
MQPIRVFNTANGFYVSELTEQGREFMSGYIIRTFVSMISPNGRGVLPIQRAKKLSAFVMRMLKDNLRCPTRVEIDNMFYMYNSVDADLIGKIKIPRDETIRENYLVLPEADYQILVSNPKRISFSQGRALRFPYLEKVQDFGKIVKYYAPNIPVYSFHQLYPDTLRPSDVPMYSTDLSDITGPMNDRVLVEVGRWQQEWLKNKMKLNTPPRSPKDDSCPETPTKRRNSI